MDLYTSLTRLKMSMNGGGLPPMTPLTEQARKYLDPSFTIGMGALVEHRVKGLRCPVRECGEYHHILSNHLNRSHKAIGGARAVKRVLGIPSRATLASHIIRERRSKATLAQHKKLRFHKQAVDALRRGRGTLAPGATDRLRATARENADIIGRRNFRISAMRNSPIGSLT